MKMVDRNGGQKWWTENLECPKLKNETLCY